MAPLEESQRAAVVREARSWLGTPYHQLGDIKGVAVDCSMLLVRCYVDAGIVAPFDPRPYPPNWHLHQSEERYLAWLARFGAEVDEPQPGDIAVFRFGRCFSHAGIMTGRHEIIHAFVRDRFVVLGDVRLDPFVEAHGSRPFKFFSIWGRP